MQVELPLECISQFVTPEIPTVPQQLAIHLRDVNFVYNQKNVLSDLSFDVPRGSMYGLLGPSGCGKTVLIRCILGTLKPTSGSIEVLGNQPGKSHSVGYMPQHTALFPLLSIRETFNYFRSIYGPKEAQLNEQCQSLIESLHLPTQTDQLVGLLSGFQKRRLSLAVALIHKPKLLILDEPTLGMDPLIRNFVWGHLVDLSLTDHLTVLVTSEYFEDIKDANLVGFMRHGQILAQDRPAALLARFQMNTLEQSALCTRAEVVIGDDLNPIVEQVGEPEVSPKISSTTVEFFPEVVVVGEDSAQLQPTQPINEMSNGFSQMDSVTDIPIVNKWSQMGAIATKNIRTLYRNKALMIFQFGLSTVLVVLFFLCICLLKHPIPVANIISSIAFFCAIPLTCITLLTEKKNGLIERTLVSGVSYFHILLSHLIPQMTVQFFQMMLLVAILFPLFGILYGKILLALSLLSLQSVCGMCFGLFVSTIARDGIVAIMLVFGLFYLNLMLSGTGVLSTETMIDYVIAGYQFEVVCAFSVTFLCSGVFLLAATLMARFCL